MDTRQLALNVAHSFCNFSKSAFFLRLVAKMRWPKGKNNRTSSFWFLLHSLMTRKGLIFNNVFVLHWYEINPVVHSVSKSNKILTEPRIYKNKPTHTLRPFEKYVNWILLARCKITMCCHFTTRQGHSLPCFTPKILNLIFGDVRWCT